MPVDAEAVAYVLGLKAAGLDGEQYAEDCKARLDAPVSQWPRRCPAAAEQFALRGNRAGYRYGGADMARCPHTHNSEGTSQCVVSRLTRSVCVSPMLVQPLTKVPVDEARVEV